MAALAIGTLLVPAVLVAQAASRGTLGPLLYYTVTYNAKIHLQPGSASHPWLTPLFVRLATGTLLPLALVVLAVGKGLPFLARRVRARAPWRGWGVRAYVASHLVVATFSASSLVRFFPHYFLVALPFLALSLGAVVSPLARKQPAALSGFVAFLVGFAALTCTFREKVDGRVSHDRAVQQAAAYVQATTRVEDRIFVWGFSPWIYGYAHRRPAGRYVFATYPTGFVPWFWAPLDEERARAVPGSMQALLDDLAREKPTVVVDAGSVMMARPLRAYPELAAWLGEGFCFALRVGAYDVYSRRPADGSPCTASGFPRPHSAVDMFGRPLRVPLPPTADAAVTRTIDEDETRYYEPRWFEGDPPPPDVDAARAAARGFDFDPWGLLAP